MSKGFRRRSRRIPGAPRPRHVLIVLALCVLAGSLVGGNARPASAAGTSPQFVRTCAAVPKGEMRCFALRRTTGVVAHVAAGINPALAVSGYGPSDLDSAYNVPTTLGGGKTVAIVDAYDDPNAASDLSTYRSNFGLPACTTASGCFTKVNQNGAASPLPAGNTGWASEIMLDLEMVSAICPNCHILLVEANSPTTANLGTAVDTAVSKGAVAVSNSYGGSESSSETSADTSYYKHAGVAIVASSGDGGYGVEYPAASPYVTAVGGTSLTRASNARGWSESVWSTSSTEGAGSGCSAFEPKPSFQTDTGCARRTVADVSADADPATGVAVYDSYGSGGWTVFGGTSVASPIIGAMYALATSPAPTAFPNSYPYADPSALNDVTTGSTATCSPAYLCTAEVGYDGPTGLGTPDGATAFGPASTGSSDFSVSVNPTNVSVAAGSNATATVSTAVTSGSSESVTLGVGPLPSGVTASFSPSTVNSGSSSTLTFTASASAAAGTSSITITGTGATGSHTTTLTLSVTATGACTAAQKITNPGFESGATGWSATTGVIGQNGPSEPAHSGTWDAWLDGYGRSHTDTVSQSVTIPSGCSNYTLSFWLHIDTAERTTTTAYDKLTVSLGSTTLATYSNLNKASGYVQHSFNVSGFAGQTVTLTFKGVEDSSLQTSFVIDDTALNVS
jgi:subtilase family serine protease